MDLPSADEDSRCVFLVQGNVFFVRQPIRKNECVREFADFQEEVIAGSPSGEAYPETAWLSDTN